MEGPGVEDRMHLDNNMGVEWGWSVGNEFSSQERNMMREKCKKGKLESNSLPTTSSPLHLAV